MLVEEGAVWQRHIDQIRASDIIMVPSAVEVPVVDESTGTAVEAEEDRPPIPDTDGSEPSRETGNSCADTEGSGLFREKIHKNQEVSREAGFVTVERRCPV